MGPKKKKKGNKLARMSEEERLRYLQHRAAMEEENKRRKEQLISIFMKNKMKHEEAFTRLNSFKINQQWRQTLRRIKNKELFDITDTMRQQFEVALETKNKIIDALQLNLFESETQYGTALNTHLEAIDRLMAIHEGRLKQIHSTYLKDRENYLNLYIKSKTKIFVEHYENKEFIESVILLTERNREKKAAEHREESTRKFDEIFHQLLFEKQILNDNGKTQIDNLNKEIQQVHEEYSNKTKQIEPFYKKLVKIDRRNQLDQNKRDRLIKKFLEKIAKLKSDYSEKKQENKQIKNKIETQLKSLQNNFNEIRKVLKENNEKSQKELTSLAIESNSAIQSTKDLVDKSEAIMSLYKKYQQYLTEEEKLIPIYSKETDEKTFFRTEEEEILEKMKHFWARYNQVSLEVAGLRVYHSNYKSEQSQLKYLLKQYMNTLSWPTAAMLPP